MRGMTISDFHARFPTEQACLQFVFDKKYQVKAYPVKGRRSYVTPEGKHLYPLKGTIFQGSSTPLMLWFYAIYLFSVSRHGVSAKELQRQLGVTYKTAWRMGHKIRGLMNQGHRKLKGVVEVDETYFGGRDKMANGRKNKSAVIGFVERGGQTRFEVIPNRETHIILHKVMKHVENGTQIMSDEAGVYKKLERLSRGYKSSRVKHGVKQWVRGETHTNNIENRWGQLKRSLRGTHHAVSKSYLPLYLNQFAFYQNHPSPFAEMVRRI